jgi:hypothetical protein
MWQETIFTMYTQTDQPLSRLVEKSTNIFTLLKYDKL